ncbi:MAG TPA: NADPH-dependent F420 reductase [Candidatus Stackebrandtia faecavium]|nr:NADPH-dependent F420 reductase [Candidatus Stackebrandtia faecavium]
MPYEHVILPDVSQLSIGILGGTGAQGRGLGYRWARAGHRVTLGSRDARRAHDAATGLAAMLAPDAAIAGTDNETACDNDIVLVAVPWEGHRELLTGLADALRDRIVIDCVNPLGFDSKGPYALPVAEGSAAQQAEQILPRSRVTAAFHHVSAVTLADPDVDTVDTDVMVLGDDREAATTVQALAGRIDGVRGIYAGRLRNAAQVEAMTANLIAINRRYKAHAGLRVSNL